MTIPSPPNCLDSTLLNWKNLLAEFMYETNDEYKARLDEMIRTGKLKSEYKEILLEISELTQQANNLGLIGGSGWGEDAKHNVIDEYEIFDNKGNILYLTLSETRSYLQDLIMEYNKLI
jgi:hypothetical protein